MKKHTYWILTVCALASLSTAMAETSALSDQLKTRYQASTTRVSTNENGESEGLFSIGGPLSLTATSQSFQAGGSTQRDPAFAAAMQFLSENPALFSASEKDFALKKRITDKFGAQHFRFVRQINGISIADMEVIVHVDTSNTITGVNGNIVRPTQLLIDYMATIDTNKLLDKAQAFERVSQLRGESTQSLRLLNADLSLSSTAPYIRWHIDLNSTAQVGRYSYWLDAETGELIDVKNTLRHPIPLIR